jgi:nucleoside-diphosphate-sugar epimerase
MARYLVTGVAGFIGSSIARRLVSQGHEVRGLDNMTSGTCANLSAIGGSIDFYCADIRNQRDLQNACAGVDGVFHQAAIASVQESIDRPIETNETNHVGTLNLLQAAREHGIKRIVFASSSAVYGDQKDPVLYENLTPTPISAYGVQKLASEHSLRVAHSTDGIETVALRYFNVFGPRQSATSQYSGVIARFIRYLAGSKVQAEPVIYGDGEQSRDFVYIEDIVAANVSAMAAPAELVAGRAFNVGSGRSHTINEVLDHLRKLTGHAISFTRLPARPGEIRSSTAGISAAANALGYTPQWDFSEGLERTLDWFRSEKQPASSKTLNEPIPIASVRRTGPFPGQTQFATSPVPGNRP